MLLRRTAPVFPVTLGNVSVEPSCSDDLLLYFPYDKNLDDVTCHHAKGYSYGDGKVRIVNDDDRGMVAAFDGESRVEVRISVYIYTHVFYVTSSIDMDAVYSCSITIMSNMRQHSINVTI